ncbi:MAG: hypothetical protein U0Z53_00900 [Blastocatellia bacterium]
MSILISPIVILLFATSVFADGESYSAKQYYLRHNIIYINSNVPTVSPDRIVFTNDCICSFAPKVYEGKILNRSALVEITRVGKEKGFAKVIFRAKDQEYAALIKNDSEKNFKRAFSLLFSEHKPREWNYKDPRTKKQMIEYYGFPISICKEEDVERWFYIIEFVGFSPYGAYDGFCVTVKNGKVVDLSGYI